MQWSLWPSSRESECKMRKVQKVNCPSSCSSLKKETSFSDPIKPRLSFLPSFMHHAGREPGAAHSGPRGGRNLLWGCSSFQWLGLVTVRESWSRGERNTEQSGPQTRASTRQPSKGKIKNGNGKNGDRTEIQVHKAGAHIRLFHDGIKKIDKKRWWLT